MGMAGDFGRFLKFISMGAFMKYRVPAVLFLLAGSMQSALADPCQDRFTELYLQLDQTTPTKTQVTTAFKGAPPTTNDFFYLSQDHYLTVPTSPEGPWVLGYGNVLYQPRTRGRPGKRSARWTPARTRISTCRQGNERSHNPQRGLQRGRAGG